MTLLGSACQIHPDRGFPLLGEGRGIEDKHGVGPLNRAGHPPGQLIDQRTVVPIDFADGPLDDLAIEIVAIRDRLGALAPDASPER